MKKLLAYWKRYWHCFHSTTWTNNSHRMITIGTQYRFMKIGFWFSANEISCECGRCYYKKEKAIYPNIFTNEKQSDNKKEKV